ncbi:MAG: DUF1015 family protein [Phycisphaerales bacterium]
MVRLHAFAALRPTPNVAARVASVPYDVASRSEAARLADGNPSSFLRVIRSEIDLPEKTDPYDPAVYTRAGENLRALQDDGTLIREASPMLYLYRLVMDGRVQLGIVGCCHLDDYAGNVIRKHERTRPDKEDDRTRHILSLRAQTGLVLLTFRDLEAFETQARRDINSRPLFHFDATDGITHTVWQVPDANVYREMFATLNCAYVADGHHRIASAARAAADCQGTEKDWFLAALFPAGALTILPYNRLVTDLAGLTPAGLLERLAEVGTVTPWKASPETAPGVFGVFIDGHWHRLELDPDTIDHADALRSLDVSLLQDRVLEPILGIADQRSDRRIEFIGGIRSTVELERRVNASTGVVAFSLHATTTDQLLTVADAGLFMPPKSTWFEPKLRSGLFVHTL